jgi:Flp pilus assembly protein TadD
MTGNVKLASCFGAVSALAMIAASPAMAAPDKPAAAAPAAAAPAPAPPAKTTPAQRAEAERLDPLARAAFWAREMDIDGRDLEAGVRLSAALRALGRNAEAVTSAQRILVIDPDNREALLESAKGYLAAGQGFYAVGPLTRLKQMDAKDWRYPSLLGIAYEQVSRNEDAEASWRAALQLSPDNPAVLSNLAMHYAARGDAAQAESLLRRAALQPGASLQVRQNLALILGLQGKLSEAEKLQREDLPPELADANMAYLRSAAPGGSAPLR